MPRDIDVHSEAPADSTVGGDDILSGMKVSWKSLFNFATRRDLLVLAPGIILTATAGAAKPISTIFLGAIFDALTSYGNSSHEPDDLTSKVVKNCLALTGIGLGTFVVNSSFYALWIHYGEIQAQRIRAKMFVGMLAKEMQWYDMRSDGISSLLVRIQTQVRELQNASSQPLAFLIEDFSTVIVSIIIAFISSWRLTLVILSTVPLMIFAGGFPVRNLHANVAIQKEHLSRASKSAYSAIASVDTVQTYNAQEHEVEQYQNLVRLAALSYYRQVYSTASQMGLTRFMTVMMFVLGFWYGGSLVRAGESAGRVLTTFYAIVQAVESAEALMPQWLTLNKGMSAGETLKYIMLQIENGRAIRNMQGYRKPLHCEGRIEIKDVSFAYPSAPSSHKALKNSSFVFPAGQLIFVIGKSGSGKSTLGNLIMKYYEPTRGSIFIDGIALQTLDSNWLRDSITLVQQESTLFNETLFTNIAFGCKDHATVNRAAIYQACETAQLQQIIHDLPEGLDTLIQADGNSLSGGQKQRVAIARARLRDSPILILDEATSALDPTNRELVMEAIRRWRHGKTTIIITHDISQIRNEDFLYILHEGNIVSQGCKRELEGTREFERFLPSRIDRHDAQNVLATGLTDGLRVFNCVLDPGDPLSAVPDPQAFDWDNELEDNVLEELPSTRLRHISHFLGVAAGSPNPSMNRRNSISLGIVRMNDLRSSSAWNGPSASPMPSHHSNQRHSPWLSSPTIKRRTFGMPMTKLTVPQQPEDIELVQLMGNGALRNRRGAISHTRMPAPTPVEQPQDIVALFAKQKAEAKTEAKVRRKVGDLNLKAILGTLWPSLSLKHRFILLGGFFCALVHAGSTPAFSYVLAQLLNTFYLPNDQASRAKQWACITIGIAFTDGIVCYLYHYAFEVVGQVWVDTLRVKCMARIVAQPRAWFDKPRNSPTALSETLDRNAEEMKLLIGRFMSIMFIAASMMPIAIIWAFSVCWQLSLVGLAATPFMFICSRALAVVSSIWEGRCNEAASAASEVFTETFKNIRVVRALTLEDYFKNKHLLAAIKAYNIGRKRAMYSAPFFGLNDGTNFWLTALIMYYGSVLVSKGTYTVPEVILTITLLLFASANTTGSMTLIPQISSSKQTASRIIVLSRLPLNSRKDPGNLVTPGDLDPLPIRFQNLTFSYPTRPTVAVLQDLNLKFEKSTSTVIVGRSGCGKSTMASLIMGMYLPNESQFDSTDRRDNYLTFNGFPIGKVNISTLRSTIAFVPQKPVLFPGSIADNIMYGLPQGSKFRTGGNIQRAARAAGIDAYISSLPNGYETQIGEGGQTLSGGQSQRISIARALIRRPKLLVLDEPTSALDFESALLVRQTIQDIIRENRTVSRDENNSDMTDHDNYEFFRAQITDQSSGFTDDPRYYSMTVIIITHSIEMMKIAQRIVCLEKGRVAEVGTWDELVNAGGAFQRLIGSDEVK